MRPLKSLNDKQTNTGNQVTAFIFQLNGKTFNVLKTHLKDAIVFPMK